MPAPLSIIVVLSAALAVQSSAPQTVLVLDLQASGVEAAAVPAVVSELVRIIAARDYRVVTREDVRDLLSLEESKQMLGCKDDAACVAELSNRLNADLVVSGTLGLVGSSVVLTMSLIDARRRESVGRATGSASSPEALREVLPGVLARLFGWEGEAPSAGFTVAGSKALSFAVFDLQADGVSADVARNLTQILSVEVKRVEGATVISRDDIVAMLQLDATKAELGCEDESCIAEIGGALGVDRLIAGSVGKLSDSYVITLRLIDAREARVDNRITESFEGAPEQLLRAVRQAARRVLGVDTDRKGGLAVTASQPSASVFVDSQAAGELPLPPLTDLSPGRHLVRIAKDGFFDYQAEVYVDPDETTVVWGELRERPEKWYQKWWLWTGVGAVVVGGVVTAILLATPAPTTASGVVQLP